ncbi:PIN-like domain-containing protein [Flavobacterium sp. DSP2-3-1]|uniref:PIN-like domain-containing protein n=1 Tax=Flavobacterium sp. DSP2-3-1 TaxID=2804620 RepID=UPI003CF807D7
MEKLYKIHRNSNQIDFQKIWKEGVFIFDSNVLLDLYRLPESAKNDLLGVLDSTN